MQNRLIPTAEELRIEIARSWRGPLYRLAAAVDIHPAKLSAILHERREATPQEARLIMAAIERQRRDK